MEGVWASPRHERRQLPGAPRQPAAPLACHHSDPHPHPTLVWEHQAGRRVNSALGGYTWGTSLITLPLLLVTLVVGVRLRGGAKLRQGGCEPVQAGGRGRWWGWRRRAGAQQRSRPLPTPMPTLSHATLAPSAHRPMKLSCGPKSQAGSLSSGAPPLGCVARKFQKVLLEPA